MSLFLNIFVLKFLTHILSPNPVTLMQIAWIYWAPLKQIVNFIVSPANTFLSLEQLLKYGLQLLPNRLILAGNV